MKWQAYCNSLSEDYEYGFSKSFDTEAIPRKGDTVSLYSTHNEIDFTLEMNVQFVSWGSWDGSDKLIPTVHLHATAGCTVEDFKFFKWEES